MSDKPTRLKSEGAPTERLREGTNQSPPLPSVTAVEVFVTGSLLRARDVAALLNVSASTVLDWWEAGVIGGYKLNGGAVRFSSDDVAEWLARQRREASR